MKKSVLAIVLAVFLVMSVFAQPAVEQTESNELTVYTYDSFTGEWGPGPKIQKDFEAKTGIKVNFVSGGDAVETYQKMVFEGENSPADVMLGISESMKIDQDLFLNFSVDAEKNLYPNLFRENSNLLPFDWGSFAFNVDTAALKNLPTCLEDLTKDEYKDKVILIDPRSSSVGLGLLVWTIEEMGEEGAMQWWAKMKDNAMTIADGWSSAYALFTEGEAPLVLSYTTSPYYHVEYENTTQYQALDFTHPFYNTIEYVGILKNSKNKEAAKEFIQFLLSDAQSDIATTNIMFPANKNTELPESFDYTLMPKEFFDTDYEYVTNNIDSWLSKWEEVMVY